MKVTVASLMNLKLFNRNNAIRRTEKSFKNSCKILEL